MCTLSKPIELILVLLGISLFSQVAQAKYGGGSGTADDPYQIATAADLLLLGDSPEDYDKHFILTADIDLDPNLPGRKVFDKALIAPDTNDVTDWFEGTWFTGVFDGNGHTISHLTIKGASWLGLFGRSQYVAEVKDLGVVDVNITGSGYYVGGLVGHNGDPWREVRGGIITRCYSTGKVSGGDDVGGLVGGNSETVSSSYSTAYVNGRSFVGGMVGSNYAGYVTESYSTGTVSGTGWGVGGLVGYNSGSLTNCYSTGAVSGTNSVGGLVGGKRGTVTQCYSAGSVSGTDNVGGLAGSNYSGTLSNCYSTGAVSGTGQNVGGLVGTREGYAKVIQCFWDIQTSGQSTSDGGMGKTTAEMQTATTFLEAGWDFVGESQNGTQNIWVICEGQDYPKLAWQFVIADYNGDGHTDLMDFCIFGQRWLGTDSSFWCPRSFAFAKQTGGGTDLTNDGFIDFEDLMVLAESWLTDTAP